MSSAITDILLHVFESFLDPASMSEGPFDDIVILKKQILLFFHGIPMNRIEIPDRSLLLMCMLKIDILLNVRKHFVH